MTLTKFYYSLDKPLKLAYAGAVNTTVDYIRIHLIPKNKLPDRTPGMDKLVALAKHSGGKVSVNEVIAHFSQRNDKAA